jgi:hypothetical protein
MATQKELYQQAAEAKLRQWRARIDLLTAQAQDDVAESHLAHYERLEALHADIHNRLRHLKDAGEQGWESAREGIDAAMTELENALERLTTHR